MTEDQNQRQHETERTGDPLIDDVRALRRALLGRFDHDLKQLGSHLRDIEKANQNRVVDRSRDCQRTDRRGVA